MKMNKEKDVELSISEKLVFNKGVEVVRSDPTDFMDGGDWVFTSFVVLIGGLFWALPFWLIGNDWGADFDSHGFGLVWWLVMWGLVGEFFYLLVVKLGWFGSGDEKVDLEFVLCYKLLGLFLGFVFLGYVLPLFYYLFRGVLWVGRHIQGVLEVLGWVVGICLLLWLLYKANKLLAVWVRGDGK